MSIQKVTTKTGESKWEVRCRSNGRGSTRIRRRFDTKAEAQHFLDERLYEKKQLKRSGIETGEFEETTFKEEAEHWLQVQGREFSAGHAKRVRGVLKELYPQYGNLSPKKFHAGLLSQIQGDFLRKTRKVGKEKFPVKAATVNRALEVVSAILSFSVKQRRIPFNPSIGFPKLKEVRDDINFWEQSEAQDFLSFANRKYPKGTEERWVYVSYLTAINTALRAGEIWGLQPKDVNLQGEVILIQRQFNRLTNGFTPTKGKRNRRVPCNANLFEELMSLIHQNNSATIFKNQNGRPICHDDFAKRKFGKDLREWGGKPIRFHDLRHTGATLMIGAGMDLKTVHEICGHEDIKTTMNYAHLLAEKIRHVARNFSIIPQPEEDPSKKNHLRLVKA